jgi:glycosyltransferase involved in cell wall biosynthesis
MRVLHVIPAIAACYGGPSKVVLDTCKALRSQGIDAEIATTNADENGDSELPVKLPVTVNGVPVHVFGRNGSWRYKLSLGLTRWLDRNVGNYDLLHIHAVFSYSTAAAAYYARKHRIPYVILPHGMLTPWPVRQNRLLKYLYLTAIEKKNLADAAAVHFTAEHELLNSVVRGRANFVLPYVLDLTVNGNGYLPSRSRQRILYLSRLDPKKGVDILIRALTGVIEKGYEFELIIAGSGAPRYEQQLRTMIAANKKLAAVTSFAGFVEGRNKARLLHTSDLFVLPSHDENFGIAVTEAMAAGLAVIVSNSVNIHDEIARENAGVIVNPTVDSVSEAILKLLNDTELRTRLGRNGQRLVNTRFSLAATTRETIRVYQDVLNNSRQSTCWRPSN